MMLGRERSLLIDNPLKRAVIGIVGDTHIGRVLRFFYLKRALDTLALEPSTILDAGCGKGYMSIYLAKRFPRAQVIGIDLNQADLAEAERVRKAAKLQNMAFLRCDLQDLIAVNIFDL